MFFSKKIIKHHQVEGEVGLLWLWIFQYHLPHGHVLSHGHGLACGGKFHKIGIPAILTNKNWEYLLPKNISPKNENTKVFPYTNL